VHLGADVAGGLTALHAALTRALPPHRRQ
jgi:hypothetical protein